MKKFDTFYFGKVKLFALIPLLAGAVWLFNLRQFGYSFLSKVLVIRIVFYK